MEWTFIISINAIIYIVIYKYLYQKLGFGATSFAILFYAVFAITAIPLITSGYYKSYRIFIQNFSLNEPSIVPYLYMLVILFFLFMPIYKNPMEYVKEIKDPLSLNIKVFIFFYGLISIITIALLLPHLSSLSSSYTIDNAADQFMDRSMGESRFTPIQQKFLNWFNVLRMVGIPLFFHYLAFKTNRKKMILFLGICTFIPSLLQCLINLSRGGMFYWLLDLVVGYILFLKFIPRNIKNKLKLIVTITLPILIISSLIITYSRYGEGSDGLMSIFMYFGEPFLNFPMLFWDHYTGCSMGEYYFKPIFQIFWDSNAPESKIARFDYFSKLTGIPIALFRTIVGSLVMEFGYWGALFFSLLWAKLFSKFIYIKNNKIAFSRFVIYYFYYMLFIQGIWGFNTNYTNIYSIFIIWLLLSFDLKKGKLSI